MTANRQDRVKIIELALIKAGKSVNCDFLDSLLIVQDTDRMMQGQPPCSDEVYGLLQALVVQARLPGGDADRAFERLRQARMKGAEATTPNANEPAALRVESGAQPATQNRPSREAIAEVFSQSKYNIQRKSLTADGQLECLHVADAILKLFPEPREWVERKERRHQLGAYPWDLNRRVAGKSDRRTAKSPTTREQELETEVERLKTDNQKLRDEADKLLFSSSQYRDELAALKSRPAPEQPAPAQPPTIEELRQIVRDAFDEHGPFPKTEIADFVLARLKVPGTAQITAEQLAEAEIGVVWKDLSSAIKAQVIRKNAIVLSRLPIPSPDPQHQADLALGKNVRKVLENPKLYHYFRLDKNSTGQWTACNYTQQVEADTPDAAVEMLAGRVGG